MSYSQAADLRPRGVVDLAVKIRQLLQGLSVG
jgi:hypothetical protein